MYVLSLSGKPAYDRTDTYLYHCLQKGQVCEEDLTVTETAADFYAAEIDKKSISVNSLCQDEENNFFEKVSTSKNSKSFLLKIVEPKMDDKVYTRHLLYSCVHGNFQGLQKLLSVAHGNLDVNQPLNCDNNFSITPLGLSCFSGKSSTCDLLLESGADLSKPAGCGLYAVHWAALANSPGPLEAILAHGGNPNQTDSQGLLPLHFACYKGSTKVVATLLKQSSPVHDINNSPQGVTPLVMAILKGHTDILKLLVKRAGAGCLILPDKYGLTPIHYVAWSGCLKSLKLLTSLSTWKEGLKMKDKWGRTPLLIASLKGDFSLCQFLVKKGARWNEIDNEGRSVLHWCIISGQFSCLNLLLESGNCACYQVDINGVSPLNLAAAKRNKETLLALISKAEQCLDVNLSVERQSPLLWGAACGWEEGVEMLLQNRKALKLDPLQPSYSSFDPLHAAASVGCDKICQALIAAEYQINGRNKEEMTPLHCASQHGHKNTTKLLLQSGATVDALTGNNESALHLAVTQGHADVVQVLLLAGASTSTKLGANQDSPIHLASSCGHSQVLKVLLTNGVNPDYARSHDHLIPIFIAAASGHLACCQVLIENGADAARRMWCTSEGLTSLDVAMKNGHKSCADYLISCHVPSSGGVYHRAALTIQAVWKYHRHKTYQRIAQEWAALTLQHYMKAHILRLRSQRVRNARHATYNRAASCIQRRWRAFMMHKRRYESTYHRLKMKLQRERLAASLIVAELQAHAHRVSLPPTIQSLEGAANVLMAGKNFNEQITSGKRLHPVSTTKENKSVSFSKKSGLPAIRHRNMKRLLAESSEGLSEETLNDVFHSRKVVSLPPELETTSTPTKSHTQTSFSKHKKKLPPITDSKGNEGLPVDNNQTEEYHLGGYGEGSTNTPVVEKTTLTVNGTSSKELSISHMKGQRRVSTFKDTPVGYQPYPSKQPKQSTSCLDEVIQHENCDKVYLLSDDEVEESETPRQKQPSNKLLESDEESNKVLNKAERYDKLMKVLSLLKQARDLEDKELGSTSLKDSDHGLQTIKEHIKLALDEAVKLRIETVTENS